VLQGETPVSLILVCHAATLPQQERLPETITANDREAFGSIFAFGLSGSARMPPGVEVVPEETVGRGLLLRLAFFADPEHLPYMVAPLLLVRLWNHAGAKSSVIAYPGVSADRLHAARQMVEGGCEAVLLRRESKASVVVALARNIRNERIVTHWADRVERFSSDPNEQEQFDPSLGSTLVDYLCDRVGLIRDAEQEPISFGSRCLPTGTKITPFLRKAVRALLPEFQELFEEPFANTVRALNTPSAKVQQDPGNLISSLMYFIWSTRPDLRAAFKLSTFDGRRNLVEWFLDRASPEYDVTEEFLAPVRSERKSRPPRARAMVLEQSATREKQPLDPFAGVNLVGYPRAEMGMGELLRQSAAALSTTDIRFSVVDFNFGIVASQRDTRYEALVGPDNPFYVNLFHINADQMPLAREKLGREFFRKHYNIGYWAWELSNFPDEWQNSIDLVDEIWAPSRFIQQAISRKTKKPVLWMPLAVEFPTPAARLEEGGNRGKFGLPNGPFLFMFSFDFSSFATRKNCSACIEAFRKAFPGVHEDVGLVIKTIRHSQHRHEFWDLLRAIGDDRRIFLIDRMLRQPEMRELIASCDSFVSLHRSEGFGFGIAEAMYLGKPVIATNYSGNLDFTKKDNSCLVDYRLVSVKAAEYQFPEGQVWADPNIDEAARYMRLLVNDTDYAERLGRAASDFIRRQHSCEAVGRRFLERLEQICSGKASAASPVETILRKLFRSRRFKEAADAKQAGP
jgi:glycosyltransferase involved in cell wall biosynthesis